MQAGLYIRQSGRFTEKNKEQRGEYMPFQIVRNDITCMAVDAIVNTANPKPRVGSGTDAGIHSKAGPKLLEARKKIGDIKVGQAAITKGYELPARYVIHTVGPIWIDGSHGEVERLRSCYEEALRLARWHRCKSVAFPLISTGNYGFPKPLALQIAINAISAFLLDCEMQVYLVVFNRDAFQLSEKLFHDVKSYIDDNYADAKEQEEHLRNRYATVSRAYQTAIPLPEWDEETGTLAEVCEAKCVESFSMQAPTATRSPKTKLSLSDLLAKTDAGFTDTLLKLIDQSGKKDSEIYKKANITKQHFSKIRKNPDYKPTKATAVAFAIALELNLEETKDLIGRAGFALTNSSKFDVIIMYFIDQGNYNMFDINSALFEFDQTLLGA